jgi:nucleoside-diphosphate-sugar epimerase
VTATVLELWRAAHHPHGSVASAVLSRANPVLGAQVNVVGHLNILEAARKATLKHVTYASSIAVYGAADEYPIEPVPRDAASKPLHLVRRIQKPVTNRTRACLL